MPVVGVVLVTLGFLAIAVSAVWTTQPLPGTTAGKYEHPFGLLLGLALILGALLGRARLAGATAGKLLCALGAAVCLSHALDPTLESISALAARMPAWMADAYPGLPTLGWIVAAVGALVWWAGGEGDDRAALYRRVTTVGALLLIVVAWGTRRALIGGSAAVHPTQPYEIPSYQTALIVWHVIQTAAVLIVTMSVCGRRRFATWPLLLFGLALVGHSVRNLLIPPPG